MNRSEWSQRKKKVPSAAAKRAKRCEAGPLFEQVAIAEQRLLDEQPELYRLLSSMTLFELQQYAFKNK